MPVRDGRVTASRHLEQAHVYKVYNQIAPKFSSFSQKAWPNVKRFLKDLKPGSLVADIGCGSGRYLPINSKLSKIGIDICCPLVECARSKGHEVLVADNLHIPFRDNTFDAVISIGVIHHFSSRSRRLAAVKELSRILNKGGKLMIYVWAYEQKKRKFESQDVLVPWHCGKDDSAKSGLSTQSSCSDNDFSSNTSLASDELSSLGGSDLDLHPKLHHTISDPSSSSYVAQTQSEVDIFLGNLPQNVRRLSDRHRSNTLPSSLEGMLSDNEHEGSNHGNLGGNVLAKECRKLEASLRAMSSSEYFLGNGDEDYDISEQGIIFNGFDEEVTDKVEEDRKLKETEENFIRGQGHFQGHGNGNDETPTDKDRREICSSLDALENLKITDSCDVQCLDPQRKESVTIPRPDSLPIRGVKYPKPHPDIKKEVKVNKGQTNGTSSHKTNGKVPGSPKRKPSVFQSLKESFLKLFEGAARKDRKSSKDNLIASNAETIDRCRVEDPNIPVDFAVREFPQSSCPVFRKEVMEISQKDQTSVLETEKSGSGRNQCSAKGSSNLKNEELTERCICVCDGLKDSVSKAEVSVLETQDLDFWTVEKSRTDHLNSSGVKSKIQGMNGASHVRIGENSSSRTVPVCLSGINNFHYEECSDDAIPIKLSKKNRRFLRLSSAGDSSEDVRLLTSEKPYMNHLSSSEKNLVSISSTLPHLISTKKCQSEKVLLSDRLPYDMESDENKHSLNEPDNEGSLTLSTISKSVPSRKSTSIQNKDASNQNGQRNVESPKEISEGDSTDEAKELSRYYHVFKDGELSKLISNHIPCLKIVSSTYDHGNWCIVAKKIKTVN